MKLLIITIFLFTTFSAYAQTDEKETLKNLNQSIVTSYKSGKYEDAQKFAQQALDLSVKIYGVESAEAAGVQSNLGIILREQKKYKESVAHLQKAVEIYQKESDPKDKRLIDALETLAFSQMLDEKAQEAESNYLKAVEIAETRFGKDSKESFSAILNTANFYARSRKFEKADEFYLKSYAVSAKNGLKENEIEQIENSRGCLTVGQNKNLISLKTFYEARNKIVGEIPEQGGIINAKAKNLPPPRYPAEARSQRLGGAIPMRVKIDEQGNVIEAKAICGHQLLAKASEDAVRKGKFETVSINGKPVKYSGIVFYYFVP